MFTIDNMSRVPVYEQIVEQTERLLLSGQMKPGDAMPLSADSRQNWGSTPTPSRKLTPNSNIAA